MVEAKKILVGILLCMTSVIHAQNEYYSILFWNLENYFDSFDNPLTADEEFTPWGAKHWTWKKFEAKRNGISKVIISSKEETGELPLIVGFCEVENEMVLGQLLKATALSKTDYGIIHRETTDSRGIDVALLYSKNNFFPNQVRQIAVPVQSGGTIREVLQVRGTLRNGDTLTIILCHAPSKWGGAKKSSPRREALSRVIKAETEAILKANPNAKIVVMGDFNDTPEACSCVMLSESLQPLALPLHLQGRGSIKYKGQWELIDQFFISKGIAAARMEIFEKDYLMVKDNTYLGKKPLRTYQGPNYLGGVSDHLPIILFFQK